jgi:hypothetical protein
MDDLSKALKTAPREAAPCRDLWPGVESRIRPSQARPWQRAAAAVLIFGAGAVAGTLAERGRSPSVRPPAGESALHRVVVVQRAGSEYVAAVARLRDLGPDDETLRAQGYEAALGVVTVAAEEVTAALDVREGEALVGRARVVRDALSRRTSGLLRGGRE